MYTFLLTSRYLFRKMTPLVGMLATLLCVGLIIVVSSIMGGFLDMVLKSGKTVIGDVSLTAFGGIPNYEALQERIEQIPEVAASTATVRTYGLVKMDLLSGSEVAYVEVLGIKGESYAEVTGFGKTLYWNKEKLAEIKEAYPGELKKFLDLRQERNELFQQMNRINQDLLSQPGPEKRKELEAIEQRLKQQSEAFHRARYRQRSYAQILAVYGDFEALQPATTQPESMPEPIDPKAASIAMKNFLDTEDNASSQFPVMIMGLEINPRSKRENDGSYTFAEPLMGRKVGLTVVPVEGNSSGPIRTYTESFYVINDFMTGFFTLDSRRVYIPFEDAQYMAQLQEQEIMDQATFEVIGKRPARVTEILVKAAPGVTAESLKQAIEDDLEAYREELLLEAKPTLPRIQVATWEDIQADYLAPIKKEKGLLTFLFGIISCVVVGMTIVIFYMIVLQKTRDIGILRSLGASQFGIACIFLIYSFVVSLIGALLGTVVGALVVTYINPIHEWLGTRFAIDLFAPGLGLAGAVLVFIAILGYVFGQGLREKFYQVIPTVLFSVAALFFSGVAGVLIWKLYELQSNVQSVHETPAWLMGELPWLLVGIVAAIGGTLSIMTPGFIIGQLIQYRTMKIGWILIPTISAFILMLITGVILINVFPGLESQLGTIKLILWDKSVYYFTEIPHEVNWSEVIIYNIIAVLASVAGAFIPAMMAARVDPVSTLRYE